MASAASDTVHHTLRQQAGALRIVATQIAVTLAVAAGALMFGGAREGYSCLVGGLIGVIPTYYAVVRVFRRARGRTPERMLRAFYTAEALKIGLSAALFVIAFVLLDVNGLVVIGGYAATTFAYWLALAAPTEWAR